MNKFEHALGLAQGIGGGGLCVLMGDSFLFRYR